MTTDMPRKQETANILDAIANIKDVLPKKQKKLCNYLLLNYAAVGMATVAELAEGADVGTTTVMRLIKALKYDSFNAFKKDLLSVIILRESSSYQSMKQAFGRPGAPSQTDGLSSTAEEGIGAIRNFLTPRNIDQFEKALTLLLKASRINILAQRSSKAAASYLEYSLAPFLPNKVRQLSQELDFAFDRVLTMSEGDILFVVANWPCGSSTMEVVHTCSDLNIPIILLTNTSVNPMSRHADIMIDTNSVNSPCLLLPAIAVIEAITSELGRRTAPESTENLEKLEEILREKELMLW